MVLQMCRTEVQNELSARRAGSFRIKLFCDGLEGMKTDDEGKMVKNNSQVKRMSDRR